MLDLRKSVRDSRPSVGTFWFNRIMHAEFEADGSAIMVGRSAKRAREEFEEEWGRVG